MLLEHF
jgi:hypothetical protein